MINSAINKKNHLATNGFIERVKLLIHLLLALLDLSLLLAQNRKLITQLITARVVTFARQFVDFLFDGILEV